ncbi:hypothetical protein BDN70DRAFT_998971 [Pholiota conissans]|uniref:Uncharacterized protein n=1 Tax=Pholiota conissans TaxID=109636 RepID=A0A9P6CL65_9AGAR|nr:hypothetical protein BDN70DRAFT_998971 [Pholiota conissans]
MLIILLFFSLFRTLQGVPLSSPTNPPNDFSTFCLRDAESHFGQRTVNDIIISCFVTIFACTWSAIHPNIPAPTDCWWTRFKRQVTTMICALVTPELMTYFAIRQRLAAREITRQYNREILKDFSNQSKSILDCVKDLFHDCPPPASSTSSINRPRWTLTHGFFLLMGGFMLSNDGRPMHILIDGGHRKTPSKLQLIYNIENGIISPPRITEEDIQDRSKGDAISKILIILQTTWFIAQCIARWSQHLPVTELEIVTLGFAMLNGITYAFWWNKPQNVGRPVFLEREMPICMSSEVPAKAIDLSQATISTNLPGSSHQPEIEHEPMTEHFSSQRDGFLTRKLRKSRDALDIFRYSLQWLVRPLWKPLSDYSVHTDRVPIFYRPSIESWHANTAINIFIPVIGVLFGAVHLIPGWFLDFASQQELWLWRTSAVIITAAPMLIGLLTFTDDINGMDSFKTIITAAIFFVLPLYPFARIILLTISLMSLRSLSSSTLQTIEWTAFIPHL